MTEPEFGFLTIDNIIERQNSTNKIFEISDAAEGKDIFDLLQSQKKRNSVVIDIRLGPDYFLSSENKVKTLSGAGEQSFIKIEPGAFAHLMTYEKLNIPLDMIAFISMKFSFSKKGLINISGFHVDPGYQGRLVFSVYNAGPKDIVLQLKQEVFMIIFSKLGQTVTPPEGKKNQKVYNLNPEHFSDLIGSPISVRSLDERIKALEPLTNKVTTLETKIARLELLKIVFIAGLGIMGTVVAQLTTHFLDTIFKVSGGG